MSQKKFDLGSITDTVKKKFKDLDPRLGNSIGVGNNLHDGTTGPFLEMPEWWKAATNTKGLYYGRMVMLAGISDSGKTSAAIEAMKAAQAQGVAVLYVETENKTTTQDLQAWGVDPDQIMLVKQPIAELAFEAMFQLWDGFQEKYPGEKLLLIIDSIGNVISERDAELDLVEQSQKPGGKGQINRLAINKMIVKMNQGDVAVLLVNYTYDQLGGHGKINAGGNAVNFFSSLTYQTKRKAWVERTVNKKKVRAGADVVWTLFKNHIDKSNPGPKEVTLRITAEGIEVTGASNESGTE